ncbi:stage II sporulation protein P [Cytobacillus firmus]|uniref:Stage II sporulation protein P n=1 Tax=Cytobacillus firmus TaxID=1399 RepID=A0A380Y509_CYTFI|nr:stage II sporulation protein P [Cytobacillus firmus]KAF0823451.1 Stage II sporulation protein P [Cytobacillus firmus]MBG9545347.1 stage II sporulation protein P [Cytobacillus firmus]MBG9547737.1 stage II sporulation protein P [Cytobacillus firmus]MBG9554441.1 stage II sporulation protein P [Cytobacillus firmus]MBG9555430.1 stage II sporulation protein P [Cytobacillus firmus]
MNSKLNVHSIFFYINSWLFSICAVVALAGAITLYPAAFSSSHMNVLLKDIKAGQLFIHFLKAENHYFYKEAPADSYSLSGTLFKLATNTQPQDIRTFLGRELPGFSIFDTGIAVAGEGTDFTNLPVESAPPLEVLLKEKELAMNNGQNEENAAPPVIPDEKGVFIYHSHSWESFAPLLKDVKNTDEAVSPNEQVNVIAVGKKLSEELARKGIGAEHDKTNIAAELKKKGWNWENSYTMSRETVQTAMTENKDVKFLIDIHRDSLPRGKTTALIGQEPYARLFFVVGKEHKNYEQNLKVATELHQALEVKYKGISRGVIVKGKSEGNGIYNQDLSERALLMEFGGVENNLDELNNSIKAFADVFSDYYWKAEPVNAKD